MIKPQKHSREDERIKALEAYSILDSLPEEDYQNLALIASQICETPIAQIVFIDKERQWVKSTVGIDGVIVPRDLTFCGHAINEPSNLMVVPDARTDARFQDNPAVIGQPKVVFYAGVSLVNEKGLPLGTICVFDFKPKVLTPMQINSLKALSNQAMRLLELRLNKLKLEEALVVVEKKNIALERFAYIAAHDLKSPLANITGLTNLFKDSFGRKLSKEGCEIINLIQSSSVKLKDMIDSLLDYSKSNTIEKEKNTKISITVLEKEISSIFAFQKNCSIKFNSDFAFIVANKSALEQILINLITNSIKYNDKENTSIKVDFIENVDNYQISVSDNGPGILEENQEIIFEIFEVVSKVDRFGLKGNGIGLSTVKNIVEALGGTIKVESEMGKGAKFIFTLARF
jgi:signal transduction histidine kinase